MFSPTSAIAVGRVWTIKPRNGDAAFALKLRWL